MFDIAINNFFHVKLLIVWKMNSEKFDGIYFQVNMFYHLEKISINQNISINKKIYLVIF